MRSSACLPFLALIISLSSSDYDLHAQPSELQQDEFKKQLTEALDANQVDTATTLIQQHRYKVGGVVAELLHEYVDHSLDGDFGKSKQVVSTAERIAKIYSELLQQDYFLKKVELYSNWTSEQLRIKATADSIREASADDFNQHKLKVALEKVQAAFELYKQIGDQEDQARCLNSIGLTYFRLTDFPKAESHLQESIEINRQIGLLRGVIANLDNLAALDKAQHKYQDALNAYDEAIQLSGELGDKESRAEQWKSIGSIYQAMRQHDKAFEYYNKALEFAKQTNNDQLKASTLLNVGSAHADKSDFKTAVELWEEGRELAVNIKNLQLEAQFLSNLGVAYRNLARYDDALNALSRALQLSRETVNRWGEGNILRETGIIYYFKGLPDSSLALWNRSIEVFKSIPDMAMVGMVTGHIGVFYKNTGKPFKALEAYQKALKLVREVDNIREEANILGNIGNVYSDILADYPMAESYYHDALEIKKRIGETSFIGVLQGILGVLKKNQGDYQASLFRYQQALKIAQQSGNRSNEAKLYGDIGAVYSDLGEQEKALQQLTRSLDMLEEIGEMHKKSQVLINLGGAHIEMGNDSLGMDYYLQATQLATEQKQPGFLITIQQNTGSVYKERGDFAKAMLAYEKALKIARDISALAGQGGVLNRIGQVNEELGHFELSMKNYQDALNITQRINSPEEVWKALFGIGSVLEKQGEKEDAVAKYAAAVDIIESIRSKLTVESLKESFMEGKIEVYHAIIKLLLDLGREEEAFDYLERAKARNLLDILSTDRINLVAGISPELLERKKRVEWQLRRVNELLRKEYSGSEAERDGDFVALLEDSLRAVRFEHEELLQEIKLNHPHYAQISGLKHPLSLAEIQTKVLTDGRALVSYLVTEEELLAWVVSRESLRYERIAIGEAELSALVDSLLHPFMAMGAGREVYNLADVRFDLKLSRKLYEIVFQPIEKYLPGHDAIIIVPDGRLHYLPFEALVTGIERRRFPREVLFSRYENSPYLIERYAISYAHSASVLDPALRREVDSANLAGKLFAVGNPDFDVSHDSEEESPVEARGSLREVRNARLVRLGNAQREVEVISRLLKPSLVLTGKAAKESSFKAQARNYEVVHLSTHAVAEESQPMYSWIAFAQSGDAEEDGFLHAYEVLNQRLNADLVTLSACETGLGKLRRGEGLIGLTRAFMYAGASSVLVSLWSVDDESTSTLMKYFYENLSEGRGKSGSLRQAKLRMLRTRSRGMSYAMPYLWAPFVLVGDRD